MASELQKPVSLAIKVHTLPLNMITNCLGESLNDSTPHQEIGHQLRNSVCCLVSDETYLLSEVPLVPPPIIIMGLEGGEHFAVS